MRLFLLLSLAFTNQFEFERFTIDDGLSQNSVYEVFQDSRGYIWLGSQGGLDRYNGYEFKHYENESGDSTSIIPGWIRAINEDKNGIIWLGSQSGTFGWFDPYQEIGREINLYEKHPGIKEPRQIFNIIFHKDNIYITTQGNGICRYNKKNNSTFWYNEDSTSNYYIKDRFPETLIPINENEFVFGDHQISILNTKTNKIKKPFTNIFEKDLKIPVDSLSLTDIIKDNNGNWYIGTWNDMGLLVLNTKEKKIYQYFPLPIDPKTGKRPRMPITELVFDNNNKLWFSIWNIGVAVFDPISKEFEIIRPNENISTSLSDPQIESITISKSGAIWLGASRSLMKYDPDKKKFKIISSSNTANTQSSFNDFWGLFIDSEDILWAGSVFRGNGVDKINLQTGEVVNILPEEAKEEKGVSFWYLEEGPGGRIWGRSQYGMFVTNKQKNIFSKVFPKSNIKPKETGGLNCYFMDSNKKLWFLTQNKTYWVEHKKDTIIWTDIGLIKESLKGLKNLGTRFGGFYENEEEKYILFLKSLENNTQDGASDQIIKISQESFQVDTVYNHSKTSQKIPGFKFLATDIIEDKNKNIWITTYGQGFSKIDNKTGKIKHYGIKDGLPNSQLYCIYEDEKQNMWMSSNYGIIKFNPKNETFRQFGMADGTQNLEFNASSHAKSKNGTLFFGGLSGINYFNPKTLKENPNKPAVLIEAFSKSDSVFTIHKSDNSEEVYNVYYYEKDLSFDFAAIDYRNPKRNNHAYMMDGYDDYWHYSKTRRYTSYTNLPPGDYSFKVKGANNDGVWNEEGASVLLKIHPAPWETKWAYFFYFVITGVGFFGYLRRQRRLQVGAIEQQRKEEELEEARQFQLDMLPKETPKLLNLEIAATIQTASEVGGDYYDFFPEKNEESMYIVVGDATGHGMTAGMMVSITKAGLYGIPAIPPNDVLKRLNRVIKNIDLGWNRMAINMARFWEDKVEFTSAAMPPVYHYHGNTGKVDEILIGGLPLGSLKEETFDLIEINFKKEDTLVFISDGLPEAANNKEEMLDYKEVKKCVQKNGKLSAEKQKDALINLGSAWLGELQNQDDITIVVVKKN